MPPVPCLVGFSHRRNAHVGPMEVALTFLGADGGSVEKYWYSKTHHPKSYRSYCERLEVTISYQLLALFHICELG